MARTSARNLSSRNLLTMPKLSNADYRSLAALRYEIRKFLSFSEQAAREAGIEPQQHQLLLAVRGLPETLRPTIRTISERLCVQHHTAVALVDKLEARGLLQRERSTLDRREVLLRLTEDGAELLRGLSTQHRQQLQTVGPALLTALQTIAAGQTRRPRASSAALAASD